MFGNEKDKEITWTEAGHVEDVSVEKSSRDDDNSLPFIPTEADEAAVIRKLDRRLLPIVFVLYSLSVLDRSNLGNARLAGLENDIDLSGDRYEWLGTIFYIAYILFQWTILGYKQFPAHIWIACTVFGWGFIATIQASVTSWGGLMACRFLLGITEAMFGPGVPFYLSFFYPRSKVGFRIGVFISGAAMANAYGSALAYGITQIHSSVVAPWQILFIIEGVPTCLLAIVIWFLIPDSADTADFLDDKERATAIYMVRQNQKVDDAGSGLKLKELLQAFKDPKSYIPAIMYFGCNVSFASLPLFVPTIISEMGSFTQIQANGLSAPPYLLCFFVIILVCWASDKTEVRGPWCGAAALVAAIGFILLATCESTAARYTGVFLAVLIFTSVAILLTWTSNIHATESKRAGGYTILATVGQCGPLLGTNIFPDDERPYFRKGMWIAASMCLLVAACSAMLSLWLRWENRKLDRERLERERKSGVDGGGGGVVDESGEENFRYIW